MESWANLEKPLLRQRSAVGYLKRHVSLFGSVLVYLQLIGLKVLPFDPTTAVQILGFIIVSLGFATSMFARKELGANWAHGAEYQIKESHTLTTSGIYGYVRHPIYAGLFLAVIGAEIVAGSFVFLLLLLALPIAATIQAKNEERILTEKFGSEYISYMDKTKMLIPYIW